MQRTHHQYAVTVAGLGPVLESTCRDTAVDKYLHYARASKDGRAPAAGRVVTLHCDGAKLSEFNPGVDYATTAKV